MKKERVIVVAPGRGSYTANELNYFGRYGTNYTDFLNEIDQERTNCGQISVRELDGMEKFKRRVHTLGENAAALIYACSMIDFFSINKEKYDIVGVAGNSMGWYISLACAGATNLKNGIKLVNTMGSMMKDGNIGGQIVYPLIDENWIFQESRYQSVLKLINHLNTEPDVYVYISIHLGGNIILAGNDKGVARLLETLEPIRLSDIEYPFQLLNHAAFHTPLLNETSDRAKALFTESHFQKPSIPLIDGEGRIWQPYSCDISALREYTLGTQVTDPYNFTKSIEVSVKEFAPDKVILLGPGSNLGGSIAQSLIMHQWEGFTSKHEFIERQKSNPYILAMGREDQRKIVI